MTEQERHTVFEHYTIPDVVIGVSRCSISAWRCGSCERDFHIELRPDFCPFCGMKFHARSFFIAPKEEV